MNARGETVPLSIGFLEMNTNNDRSAENKVGGDGGMEKPREVGLGAAPVAEPFPLRRSEATGEGESADWEDEERLVGDEESVDCMMRSRKGAQK